MYDAAKNLPNLETLVWVRLTIDKNFPHRCFCLLKLEFFSQDVMYKSFMISWQCMYSKSIEQLNCYEMAFTVNKNDYAYLHDELNIVHYSCYRVRNSIL